MHTSHFHSIRSRLTRLRTGALLLLLCNSAAWATVTASVDRNSVAIDESFQLTISSDEAGFFDSAPDFSTLSNQFNILGRSQQTSNINGDTKRSWALRLSPKTAGKVSIPVIEVAGEKTQPITMTILSPKQAPRGGTQNSNSQLYIEATADHNTVYKGAQFVYTLRVYAAVPISGGSLSQPDFGDATVKELNNDQFDKVINGIQYTVIERRYAVFPHAIGELEIAPAVLQAKVPYGRRSAFGQSQVRSITRRSEMATVNVIEPPETYSGNSWLPASQFSLQQQWSKNPQQLMVGDSVTRTIQQQAAGLTSPLLPPISEPTIDGLKFYLDQPKLSDTPSAEGNIAKRSDSYALIATRVGSFTLPSTDISWWNTTSNRLEHATLPETKIVVVANPNQPTPATPAVSAPPPTTPSPTAVAPATLATENTGDILLWQETTALFVVLWLATLAYCLRLRRRPRTPDEKVINTNTDELSAYTNLKGACLSNAPQAAEDTLLIWGKYFYADTNIAAVSDIVLASRSASLKAAWQQLQSQRYSDDSSSWQGSKLIEAIDQCRSPTKEEDKLAPLYPR